MQLALGMRMPNAAFGMALNFEAYHSKSILNPCYGLPVRLVNGAGLNTACPSIISFLLSGLAVEAEPRPFLCLCFVILLLVVVFAVQFTSICVVRFYL